MSLIRPTHSQKLERWLGTEEVEHISHQMKDWYGPPIAIAGVPGTVYATKGGDFCGSIEGGYYASLLDYVEDRVRATWKRFNRQQMNTVGVGFASLSDLISEATVGGKRQSLTFSKTGTAAAAIGNAMGLWNVGAFPPGGGNGPTSGTGAAPTNATSGALPIVNAGGSDTLHFVNGTISASAPNTLLLYDRLWHMTHNHATALSTNVDAVNRPTRYQTTSSPGNFFAGEVTTALSATAHNITITYVDQATNAAEAAAAYAAPVSAAFNRLSLVSPAWFLTLNSADTGLQYITNVTQSTITSVTGVTSWFIGHPIAFFPCPIANMAGITDGLNTAFNLKKIETNACLTFLELPKPAATATTYYGNITLVSG